MAEIQTNRPPRQERKPDSPYWQHEAKGVLRAELGRRGVTYERLAKLLVASGVSETDRSIANKISRGTFSFVFFLQAMRAIGATSVSLEPTQKAEGVLYSGQPVPPKKPRKEYQP